MYYIVILVSFWSCIFVYCWSWKYYHVCAIPMQDRLSRVGWVAHPLFTVLWFCVPAFPCCDAITAPLERGGVWACLFNSCQLGGKHCAATNHKLNKLNWSLISNLLLVTEVWEWGYCTSLPNDVVNHQIMYTNLKTNYDFYSLPLLLLFVHTHAITLRLTTYSLISL